MGQSEWEAMLRSYESLKRQYFKALRGRRMDADDYGDNNPPSALSLAQCVERFENMGVLIPERPESPLEFDPRGPRRTDY